VIGALAGAGAGAGAFVHHWIVADEPAGIGPTAATSTRSSGRSSLGSRRVLVPAVAAGLIAHSPPAAAVAAVGAGLILSVAAALVGSADWATVIFLVVFSVLVGAFAAAISALPIALRRGVQ
jgi:hypothetical protein